MNIWVEYEKRKAEIIAQNLDELDYIEKIRQLADELGV